MRLPMYRIGGRAGGERSRSRHQSWADRLERGIVDLTGKYCSPNTIQWTFDTWAASHTIGDYIAHRGGKQMVLHRDR